MSVYGIKRGILKPKIQRGIKAERFTCKDKRAYKIVKETIAATRETKAPTHKP